WPPERRTSRGRAGSSPAIACASLPPTQPARQRSSPPSPFRKIASVLASLSSSLTSQVASHGAYAVFALMAIDAVFPAASELVMLYAGAVAAGVFGSADHV